MLDSLFAFFIMSIITLTFIEMINHLLINYQNQIDNIEMQKIIIVSLNKFDLNHLKQGVNICLLYTSDAADE